MLDGIDVRLGERDLPDAAVYVDAGYEGDLLPRFGVPYAQSLLHSSPPTTTSPPAGVERWGSGASVSTSSPTRAAGRTSCTSATAAGCRARTSSANRTSSTVGYRATRSASARTTSTSARSS